MNNPTHVQSEIDKLDHAIAAQQALRGILPDDQIDAVIQPLQTARDAYQARLSGAGAIAQGEGSTAVGAAGVNIKGDVGGSINTGLILTINQIVQRGEDPAEAQEIIAAYLDALVKDCARLKLAAIDQAAARPGRQPLELADVYVDLNTEFRIPGHCKTLAELFALDRSAARDWLTAGRIGDAEAKPVAALDALAYHRELVLLGRPGSGKSTFTSYTVLNLAQAALGNEQALGKLGERWTHGPLLPVRVVLRQFAAELPAEGADGRAGDLWAFIQRELVRSGSGLSDKTASLIQRIARKSGALFLLDGLDECGDAARQARVLQAVNEFKQAAGDACRFLITARPYAWPSGTDLEAGVYSLADLNDQQVQIFITNWYRALSAPERGWLTPAEAQDKRKGLSDAVKRVDLQPLARNPLLLTLMATLQSNRGRLPDDRVDLYDEVVNLLLQRWNERIGADKALLEELAAPSLTLTHLRGAIEQLAFEAHAAHLGQEGTADIDEDRLRRVFARQLQGSLDKAGIVVDYIEKRAGLLIGQGLRDEVRHFTFPHRTFQEYLAACHLANRPDFSTRAAELAQQDPAHWREVLVLAARQAKVERGAAVADALIHAREVSTYLKKVSVVERDWQRAILAGEQLLEVGVAAVEGSEQAAAVRERVAGWLVALLEHNGLPARERARAGRVLGRLGDPRLYVMTCAAMQFCVVPSGRFVMGSRDDSKAYPGTKETPQWQPNVPYDFAIGRFPVSNAQYSAFMADGGYARADFWPEAEALAYWRQNGEVKRKWSTFEEDRIVEHEEWANHPFSFGEPYHLSNHPVVGINWFEAVAFTRWLSATYHVVARLPTEIEWEKAARGPAELRDDVLCAQLVPMKELSISPCRWLTGREAHLSQGRDLLRGSASMGTRANDRDYPWSGDFGMTRANSLETEIRTTSAVGCFPAGASPYGCEEMVGNAWEWCLTSFQESYNCYRDDCDGPFSRLRVVRGGSFGYYHGSIRCAGRIGNDPDEGTGIVGFRVVMSPSTSEIWPL